MRFQTKYDNYVIVIAGRPKAKVFNPAGLLVATDPGLRAEFSGLLHIFDSERAQKTYRWSDEDRIEVEKFLVSSPNFGVDYHLAFDEVTPKYLEEWMEGQGITLGPNFSRRCGKVWAEDDDIIQCKNNAVPGKDFCAEHLPKAAKSGISSTANVQ